jgi:predicted ATPase
MAKRKRSTPGPYLQRMTLLQDRIPDTEQYPYALPAVRYLDTLDFHPKVTFFVGENGAGKSTLLEAIAVDCDLNPEGGSRNFRCLHLSLWSRWHSAGALHRNRAFLGHTAILG